MAFNPFKGFRKYQKIWMAVVLLLCMVTFVLCTGFGGDLSDYFLQKFGRDSSPPMVEIDGSSLRRKQMSDLKIKREIANTFMIRGQELVMQIVLGQKKEADEDIKKIQVKEKKLAAQGKKLSTADMATLKKRVQHKQTLALIENEFSRRAPDSLYFGGGVKFDDLVNHKLKLLEADRLGVSITTDQLWNMVRRDLFFHVVGGMPVDTINHILNYVREQHSFEGSPEMTRKALLDEFRVRIATDAIEKSLRYMQGQQERLPLAPNELWDFHRENRSQFDIKLLPFRVSKYVDKVGEPKKSELEELFEKYKDQLYDPASDTPGFTAPQQVKVAWVTADPKSPEYVNKAKKERAKLIDALAEVPPINFNPGAPIWASIPPPGANKRMAAAMIFSDYLQRKERVYKSEAEYSAANLAFELAMYTVARQAFLQKNRSESENKAALAKKPAAFVAKGKKGKLSWTDAHALLFSTWLPGCASPQASLTAPMIGQAAIYQIHEKKLKPLVDKESARRAKRIPDYMTIFLGGAVNPLTPISIWQLKFKPDEMDLYLPEAVVEKELRERRIEDLAAKYAGDTMLEVKDAMDKVYDASLRNNDKDPKLRILPVLNDLIAKYELTTYVPALDGDLTNKWYSKYDIDDAKAVQPLKKAFESFISGGTQFESQFNNMMGLSRENWVKDGDFRVLFFEGPETMKWANQNWAPRVWPPEIMPKQAKILKLNDDKNKPKVIPAYALPHAKNNQIFLFWRTDDQPLKRPRSLKDVESLVMNAWKMQKARKGKVIPTVEKFAESLQKANVDAPTELQIEAKKLDETIVDLPNFSPLYVVDLGQFQRSYLDVTKLFAKGRTDFEYEKLIREHVKFPSKEMGKQLVTMMNWKEAVKTGNKEVDKINIDLFKNAKKLAKGLGKEAIAGKKVQILINQPQTEFLVAVITEERGQQFGDFITAYQLGATEQFIRDPFLMIAQDDAGKQFEEAVIRQLRNRYRVDPKADAKEIKDFNQAGDTDG